MLCTSRGIVVVFRSIPNRIVEDFLPCCISTAWNTNLYNHETTRITSMESSIPEFGGINGNKSGNDAGADARNAVSRSRMADGSATT
jgi:hypothetical protein